MPARPVLHVDLDQFIVAVELLRRPDLRGRPVVVGDAGDLTRRGVVAGASYEARRFGVHSAMPLRRAAARCPDLVCLPLDLERYQVASAAVMEALRSLEGAVVEIAGWDEAFLAVDTADPEGFARGLQAAVRDRTGLSCSVGIGDNKLQAKTATELAKPGGIARLTSASWPARMGPRPSRELPGVGSKTARRLCEHGIDTVSELADTDATLLAREFGPVAGPRLRSLARGEDRSPVSGVPRQPRSRGRAVTFQHDLDEPGAVRDAVRSLADQVASQVAAEGRHARRVVVTVRFAPFETHSHGTPLGHRPGAFEQAAVAALDRFVLDRPVRLVGVRAELEGEGTGPAPPRSSRPQGTRLGSRQPAAAGSAGERLPASQTPRAARDTGPVIRAVVFDLDGVLLDSEQVWDEVRREVVAEQGGRWRAGATAAMQGMSSREWATYLRDHLGLPLGESQVIDAVVARMQGRYRDALPLIAGAPEAVRRIGERWPLGLASSSNRVLIDEVLEVAGFSDLFRATVSSEEVSRGKPAPDVYAEAARRLGVPPADCVAVEDSANGIRSALAAGLCVVAVPNPHYPPAGNVLAQADVVIEDLGDLTEEVIESLFHRRDAIEQRLDEEEIESFPASDPHSEWAGP